MLSASRLSTWLQCGWRGNQTYNLGFESGLVESYNLLGTVVHELIERIHDVDNFWKIPVDDLVTIAHKRLDDIWRGRLYGREELVYFKKYNEELEAAYEDSKKVYEKRTGKTSKSPWMTTYYLETHKPRLDKYKKHFERISKNINLDAFEPIEVIFKDSYKFVENYVRLIRKELWKPKEVISELDFESEAVTKMAFWVDDTIYPFRGKIDQIWLMADGDIFVLDIKSGRKKWNSAAVRNSDQLFLYAKYVLMTYDKLPEKVGIVDVRNSLLTQWFVEPEDFERFVNRYNEKVKMYHHITTHKIYTPAAGSTDNFCSYCPIGRTGKCIHYSHTEDNY